MTPEILANAVVADGPIRKSIQAQFGDAILLIDAESWLNGMNRLKNTGHVQVSDLPSTDVLAVAVLTKSKIGEELKSLASELHLPYRSFDHADEVNIRKWIVDVAFRRASDAWVDAGESRRAAAILRQDLDRQQQSFQALEVAVQDFGMPQFTLALDLPLAMGRLILAGNECTAESLMADNGTSGELIQRLPISARRIASVELYCERLLDYPDDGKLTVRIADLAGTLLASSEAIDISELAQGWNRFNFPMGIDCTDRDAVLKLSLSGTGAIRLSLGPFLPIERFHPTRLDSTAIYDAPLAMKIWRGFAGVRTPTPLVKIFEGGLVRRRSGEVPKARLHFTDDQKMAFEPVQYWMNEDGFLVHPPAAGVTVAIIENIELENIAAASAIVNNGHRDSPPISFAIGIVESGSFFHLPDILGSWLTLPPMGWGEVHAALPESASGRFDLVLATMVATGKGNNKAWGLFRGFMFNTHSA